MGAKNFGRKKRFRQSETGETKEKKLKALRFAGINVDVKEKDEVNGETTMMTTDNDETEVSTTTPSRKRKEREICGGKKNSNWR